MIDRLILIGIVVTTYIIILLLKNRNNKIAKYVILIGPFILSGILYHSIFLLTKDMSPYECDGAALFGILISFILLGMGILFNLIYLLHLALAYRRKI